MRRVMNRKVMVTCALTGAGDTVGRSEHVPVTPEQIAESGIEAARAGATIVHVHVRDPQTGRGSRDVALYREVVDRIRASDVDVIINTTAGMGGDLMLDPQQPTNFVEGTDLVNGVERLAHVAELLPDICTLDCGSLNFGEGSMVYVSTPDMLRDGAKLIQELGVRVEMEIFDTGHLWFARRLVEEGLIDAPPMFQLCMDIPYGAPADPALLTAMVDQLPEGAVWSSFALGRMQMPWVAQSVLLGGHVRVGLEDNLYLSRGVKATNAQLVERARTIVEAMGAEVATPDDAREILSLRPRGVSERVDPASVRSVACVGAGVIGGGWAAYFLAHGYDVVAWDPAPDAEARLRHVVDSAWPALTELGLADGASRDRLVVECDLAKAVADADLVQESAPEQLDLKIRLLADIDAVTPPHVVIASSTSGYGMSQMQVGCAHPSRTVVAHPFNPPYLIPLVEVVGGARTAPQVVAWTSEFFRHAGKSVITMDREVPGFVANRLQEALWREALHMVAAGEATVEQIDLSITDGPGLRWPVQGPCLTFHLAGGQGGMAHMLDHFGPSLQSPWTRLVSTELTPELRDEMVAGCERKAAGRSIDDLVAERDRGVIAVLRALGRA